jgi:hypothetical protein
MEAVKEFITTNVSEAIAQYNPINSLDHIKTSVLEVLTQVWNYIVALPMTLTTLLSNWTPFTSLHSLVLNLLKLPSEYATALFEYLKKVFSDLPGLFTGLLGKFTEQFAGVSAAVKHFLGNLVSNSSQVFAGVLEYLLGLPKALLVRVKDLSGPLLKLPLNLLHWLKDFLVQSKDLVLSAVGKLKDFVVDGVKSLSSSALKLVSVNFLNRHELTTVAVGVTVLTLSAKLKAPRFLYRPSRKLTASYQSLVVGVLSLVFGLKVSVTAAVLFAALAISGFNVLDKKYEKMRLGYLLALPVAAYSTSNFHSSILDVTIQTNPFLNISGGFDAFQAVIIQVFIVGALHELLILSIGSFFLVLGEDVETPSALTYGFFPFLRFSLLKVFLLVFFSWLLSLFPVLF